MNPKRTPPLSMSERSMNQRPMNQRRRFLIGSTAWMATANWFSSPGLFAEELSRTPKMTEGPFYPDQLPLDQDNDLIVINDSVTPAVGEITDLTGRILDSNGQPLVGAAIEIWQCDANGVYLHSRDSKPNKDRQDKHFQGYGKFETDTQGQYRFRTIKPVEYSGRPAPHIHFKILRKGKAVLTSQIFVADDPGNAKDGLFKRLGSEEKQNRLMAKFVAQPDTTPTRYRANFDIVLGKTPT